MQLKITKETSKKVLTVELETVNFSQSENLMLDELGEPIIKLEKTYGGVISVNIEKKVRSGFKVKQKFDGNEITIEKAIDYSRDFLDDIQDAISSAMTKLKDEYSKDLASSEVLKDIRY